MKDGAREVEGGRGQEGRECTDESVMDQRKFQNELDMKERREEHKQWQENSHPTWRRRPTSSV